MQRITYYVPFFLAALAVLLPASLAHAQITLDAPAWRVEAADVSWLTQNNTDRGGAYNPVTDHVLIASAREGGSKPAITILNAENGTALGTLNVTGVTGGSSVLSQIAVTEDGQIFATNFTRDAASSGGGASGPAKIYYWASEDAAPVVAYTGDPSAGAADENSRRFGEGLGVSGTGNSVDVYLSSDRNTQLAKFNWNRDTQTMTGPTLITVGSGEPEPFDGASDGIAAAPGNADALWVNGIDQPVNLISAADGSVIARIPGNVIDFSYDGLAVAEINGRVLLAAGPGNLVEQDQTFRVVDVTDPSAPSVRYITESVGETISNPTRSGFVAFDTERNNLIVFSTNNAIASYALTNLGTFTATLRGYNEVGPVMTSAEGEVSAELEDGTLTVTGSFEGLSSELFEIAGSAAHIHVGGPSENGPVVIPLNISADADNQGGSFEADANTFDLSSQAYPDGIDTDSVMSAIMNGNAYVNVHTANFNSGEIRGQILLSPNQAPEQATITSPMNEASIILEGADSQALTVDWEDASDPEGNTVVYVWQLAADADFNTILFQTNTGTESAFTTRYRVVDSLLAVAGVATGSNVTLYHRANAQDGSLRTEGETASVTLVRNVLPVEGEMELPERFTLDGNYPNPFNPSTSIRFDLPGAASVSLKVYDVMGREVMALPAQAFGAGARQELRMDAASLSSGTYFYRVIAQMGTETEIQTGTMVLIK